MTEPRGDVCRCGRPLTEHAANEAIGPTKHWPVEASAPEHDESYYRARLRALLAESLSSTPGTPCHFCQAESHEWCEWDCGSPFPVLYPHDAATALRRVLAEVLDWPAADFWHRDAILRAVRGDV